MLGELRAALWRRQNKSRPMRTPRLFAREAALVSHVGMSRKSALGRLWKQIALFSLIRAL